MTKARGSKPANTRPAKSAKPAKAKAPDLAAKAKPPAAKAKAPAAKIKPLAVKTKTPAAKAKAPAAKRRPLNNAAKPSLKPVALKAKQLAGAKQAMPKAQDVQKTVSPPARSGNRPILLSAGYRPNDGEPFMNDRQREYFRHKLNAWKDEILRETTETLAMMQQDTDNHADIADRASSETDRAIELRARDRQRKLIAKIDSAISRIDEGTYGYCEETGDPINLRRLDARPIATLSIEAQERHEKRERVYRDE